MLINMTKNQYIEWYKEHLNTPPRPYLLEKYEFIPEPMREVTQEDWTEFWSEA